MLYHYPADLVHMRRCLTLARGAKAAGETAVGSLVVLDGDVIGEGAEATRANHDPSAHAEIVAIRAACRARGSMDLSGGVLYSSVEPCFMCAYAIRATRISRVVVGATAGQVGAVDSHYAFLSDPGFAMWGTPPKIRTGVFADEARQLLST